MPRQYNSPDLIIPTVFYESHESLRFLLSTFVYLPYFFGLQSSHYSSQ